MRVLFVSSEIYPLAKTGGLADVSAALPRTLSQLGADIELIMPGYPQALETASHGSIAVEFTDEIQGIRTRLVQARTPDSGLPVWLVDCPVLYDRRGTPYQDQNGVDWPDNAQRFAHLSYVAGRLARGDLIPDWRVDVVHANDWHVGLLPVQLRNTGGRCPSTLFTVHNLAFQGLFPSSTLPKINMPLGLFTPEGIEFHGQISFLKAGIQFSDHLTTVSPSYAREILTPEYGCGLDGLLQQRATHLTGILNGVDYQVWDPAHDTHLPANYQIDDLSGKSECKTELQRKLGLPTKSDVPLIVWISRITHQKMADTLLDALPAILERNVQFALLGQGDLALEGRLRNAACRYPDRMSVRIGYEEALAHFFYGGGDILLHPSRFEPCGLTPLYGLRYGTLPVVRHVGGLIDTIVCVDEQGSRVETANGFGFLQLGTQGMLDCLDQALSFYAQPVAWRKLQKIAMSCEFDWFSSARRYMELYGEIASRNMSSLCRPVDAALDPANDELECGPAP
jgi:starch synthase